LSIILKSKIGKKKRETHIEQLEKELGIGEVKIIPTIPSLDSKCEHYEYVRTTEEYTRLMRGHYEGQVVDTYSNYDREGKHRWGYGIKLRNGEIKYLDSLWLERCG